ncbi:MAG: aminoacyl-tRNA hydrolase [Patescibacteria group bacterium]
MDFLLVGLGNPGERYSQTRHNAGFLVLDALARRAGVRFSRRAADARSATVRLEGRHVVLAKPQTYMNASGTAVAGLVRRHAIPLERLLIVSDDMDLPLGALRLRRGGGSGGHHGLDSIIAALGTKDFARLRLGVGRPAGGAVDHVLGRFSPDERERFQQAVARATEAVLLFLRDGLEAAMNTYNRTAGEP